MSNSTWPLGDGKRRVFSVTSSTAASSSGVTDHGALTGLLDNDHPQYLSTSGGTIFGDLIISGGLFVSGQSVFNNNITVSGDVFISGDIISNDGSTYITQNEGDVLYQASGNYQPSGNYITIAQGDIRYQLSGNYQASGNYITLSQGAGLYAPSGNYEISGTADTKVAAHEAAADPHPQYLTEAEGDALYVNVSGDTITGNLTISGNILISGDVISNDGSIYITQNLGDTLYTLSGNYQASGNYVTFAAGDVRYQFSGLYQPSGDYVTRTEGDSLYAPISTVGYSGIRVRESGAAINEGISLLTFLNSTVLNLGGGEVLISGGAGAGGGGVSPSRLLTAGSGMIGGGDLSADRRFDVIGISGIRSLLDAIELDLDFLNIRYQASGNYQLSGNYITVTDADIRYVNVTGDTINGNLVISGDLTVEGDSLLVGTITLSGTTIISGILINADGSTYLTQNFADTLYAPSGNYETSGTADARIAGHEAAADPHPQYLTQTEADVLYEPSGAIDVLAGSGLVGVGEVIHVQVGSGLYLQDDLVGVDLTQVQASGNYVTVAQGDVRYSLSGNYQISGNYITFSQGDVRYSLSGNYQISGNYITIAQGDIRYSLSGNYQISGDYVTFAAGDIRYSLSGNYQVSGDYVTVAQGDIRYSLSGNYQASGNYITLIQGNNLYQPSGVLVPHGLTDHTDVVLGVLVSGYSLKYNGSQWVASPDISGEVPQSRTLTAGSGMINGGDLTQDRRFDVIGISGIQSNQNDIQLDFTFTDGRYSLSGNYQISGNYVTVAQGDTRYALSGNYQISGNYVTFAAGDIRYQLSGLYQPSGDYVTQSEGDTLYAPSGNYELSGTADLRISGHEAAADPHPQYLTQVEADALYEPSGAIDVLAGSGLIGAGDVIHVQIGSGLYLLPDLVGVDFDLVQPSGDYVTVAQGDNRYTLSGNYEISGTADLRISGHEAAADPHPQYLTQAEGDALYLASGTGPAGPNLSLQFRHGNIFGGASGCTYDPAAGPFGELTLNPTTLTVEDMRSQTDADSPWTFTSRIYESVGTPASFKFESIPTGGNRTGPHTIWDDADGDTILQFEDIKAQLNLHTPGGWEYNTSLRAAGPTDLGLWFGETDVNESDGYLVYNFTAKEMSFGVDSSLLLRLNDATNKATCGVGIGGVGFDHNYGIFFTLNADGSTGAAPVGLSSVVTAAYFNLVAVDVVTATTAIGGIFNPVIYQQGSSRFPSNMTAVWGCYSKPEVFKQGPKGSRSCVDFAAYYAGVTNTNVNVTNQMGLYVDDSIDESSPTNAYGVYIEENTGASTINASIWCAGAGRTYFRGTGSYISSEATDYLDLTALSGVRINDNLEIEGDLDHDGSNAGFYGTAPIAKPVVSGARNNPEQALANLLTALSDLGLITDNTTAS